MHKHYDDSNAPTQVYVYNPTPEVIRARHEGYNLVLPPNTRTRWYSEQYLGPDDQPNGQYVPIPNWAARAMCDITKWGREGLVLLEPNTDPAQAAKTGLVQRVNYIESCIRGTLRHHSESKTQQQLLRARDIRCNDMHHPRHGDPWFIPVDEMTRDEREKVDRGEPVKLGIYNDQLAEIRGCLDNIDTYVKGMITVHDEVIKNETRDLQRQIERLMAEKGELIDELRALKPDGRTKEARTLKDAEKAQGVLQAAHEKVKAQAIA